MRMRASGRGWIQHRARRLMAALSVCAPSWKRYSGQMSSVPPARSIRVGADALMCTPKSYAMMLTCMTFRDIRRHVGQLAIVGFDGHEVPPETKMLAREFDLGGVIFFARNVESPEQVADL